MASTVALTPEVKKQIYNKLADDLIESLEKGEMTTDDSEQSSVFILGELEKAATVDDALLFLQALSTRWPGYQSAYLWIRKEVLKVEDQEKAQNVTEKLQAISKQLWA